MNEGGQAEKLFESLQITSVLSPHEPVDVNITNSEPLGMGKETKKLLSVRDTQGNTTSLVERDYFSPDIDIWREFREAGMPVVPDMWLSSRKTMLVPDLKADGSELYGKGLYLVLSGEIQEERSRPKPDIDKMFVELLQPDNVPALRAKVSEYVERANANNLYLPYDDAFELQIRPDGTWDLVTLDLRNASKATTPMRMGNVPIRNGNNAHVFLHTLENLHRLLTEGSH